MSFFRKYYVQVLLFLTMASNHIATYWQYDTRLINGIPAYFYYWVLFDHYHGIFTYLLIPIFLILFKLKSKYERYALWTMVLYASITGFEYVLYRINGNNTQNEYLYLVYLGAFVAGLFALSFTEKLWDDERSDL